MNPISNHDIVAFAVVELGVTYPLADFLEMTTEDPMYEALMERWREKQEREQHRFAVLSVLLAKQMGNKNAKVSDFMYKKKLSPAQQEKQHKKELEAAMLKQELRQAEQMRA